MDLEAKNWLDLHDILFADSYRENLGRYRSNFVFRGLSDSAHNGSTSLMRLGGPYEKLERPILRNFRKYAYAPEFIGNTEWHWLALAQHHGLPTRLLDWTNSPLVALHFATAELDKISCPGVVWCLDCWTSRNYLPEEFRDKLLNEYAIVFTSEMLSTLVPRLDALDDVASEEFALFLEPPALDGRIVNQFGLFSLMSNVHACIDKWAQGKTDLFRRVIIPSSLKLEVRDKLDQMNITERVLFPGLGGLCQWLKRYYSPVGTKTGKLPPPPS